MEMIRSSTIFLCVLTDAAVRSIMVRNEIAYAVNIRKPCILLKEESVTLDWNAEWIPFSKYDEPISVFQTIMAAVENIKKDQGVLASPLIGILGVALISFILGLSLRK